MKDSLHSAFNEIGYPVALMKPDGTVFQHNLATAQLHRSASSTSSHSDLPCSFLYEDDGTFVIQELTTKVTRSGERQECELWRFDRWWHVHLVPVRTTEGAISHLLLFAQDITPLKKAQLAQLAEVKAKCKTLAREQRHRIKNHLQGLVGLLRSRPYSSRSVSEVIDKAVIQIQSFATLYGLEAKLCGDDIPLDLLLRQTAATLNAGSPIPVHWTSDEFSAPDWKLCQERGLPLSIAIGELLMNAVKHTRPVPGAQVTAQLQKTGHSLSLIIINAPAHLPERFQVIDPDRSSDGLALVTALLPPDLVELHITQTGDAVTTVLNFKPTAWSASSP